MNVINGVDLDKKMFDTSHSSYSVRELVDKYYPNKANITKVVMSGDMFTVHAFIFIDCQGEEANISGPVHSAVIFATTGLDQLYFYEINKNNEDFHVTDAGIERYAQGTGGVLSVIDFLNNKYNGRNYYEAGIRAVMKEFIIRYDTHYLRDHVDQTKHTLQAHIKA